MADSEEDPRQPHEKVSNRLRVPYSVVLPQAEMAGVFMKKSRRRFQRRLVLLWRRAFVLYYVDSRDPQPRGTLNLLKCKAVVDVAGDSFSLDFGFKTYVFRVDAGTVEQEAARQTVAAQWAILIQGRMKELRAERHSRALGYVGKRPISRMVRHGAAGDQAADTGTDPGGQGEASRDAIVASSSPISHGVAEPGGTNPGQGSDGDVAGPAADVDEANEEVDDVGGVSDIDVDDDDDEKEEEGEEKGEEKGEEEDEGDESLIKHLKAQRGRRDADSLDLGSVCRAIDGTSLAVVAAVGTDSAAGSTGSVDGAAATDGAAPTSASAAVAEAGLSLTPQQRRLVRVQRVLAAGQAALARLTEPFAVEKFVSGKPASHTRFLCLSEDRKQIQWADKAKAARTNPEKYMQIADIVGMSQGCSADDPLAAKRRLTEPKADSAASRAMLLVIFTNERRLELLFSSWEAFVDFFLAVQFLWKGLPVQMPPSGEAQPIPFVQSRGDLLLRKTLYQAAARSLRRHLSLADVVVEAIRESALR